MRFFRVLMFVIVAACGQTTTSGGPYGLGHQPQGAQQAYFDGVPTDLFDRARAGCNGPGQTLTLLGPTVIQCASLPDPQTAAAVILQFDGTVEDLPTFVIELSGLDTADGYLVTADSFIRVPSRTQGRQQIRFPDLPQISSFQDVFLNAGGRPVN